MITPPSKSILEMENGKPLAKFINILIQMLGFVKKREKQLQE